MKNEEYMKELGATAACTIRAGRKTTQDEAAVSILMGDAWFGSIRAIVAAAKYNMEAIYQVKSNHGLYPKQYIEDTLKEAPGGTSIVLQGEHPDGPTLVAVGYRYNSKVTLCFVITKNAGSTKKGKPYEMKFADSHGNVHVRLVDRPAVISDFFEVSNTVDKHNHARQYELALEKKWETRDPMFRLTTSVVGVTCIDTLNISKHHLLFSKLQQKHNAEQWITVDVFAGILTKQLIRKAEYHRKAALEAGSAHKDVVIDAYDEKEDISDMSDTSEKKPSILYYPVTTNKKGKSYTKSRRCVLCKTGLTVAYCSCCEKSYCYSVSGKKHDRNCMLEHLKMMKRKLNRITTRSSTV